MDWQQYADYFKDLNLSDIPGMAQWAMGATRPQPEFQGWGPQGWAAQAGWQNEQLEANPMGVAGMTKILGPAGGNRLIQSFHDKTGQLLGSLGYKDFPGKGAVFQSIQSESPRGTAELLGRFRDEMGPLMNDVKIGTTVMPQAAPHFQTWVNRGRLDQWPDLKNRLQEAVNQSRQQFEPQGWANPLGPDTAIRRAYVQRPAPKPQPGTYLPELSDKQIKKEWGKTRQQLKAEADRMDDLMDSLKLDWEP